MFDPKDDDVVVCRCEEVTLGDIRRAIASGADSVRDVKLRTHAGMGICQGMTCRRLVERILRDEGIDPDPCAASRRFPVRPVSAADLARLGEDDGA